MAYLNVKGVELPVDLPRQAGYVHTLGDVDGLGQIVDVLEGTLDT